MSKKLFIDLTRKGQRKRLLKHTDHNEEEENNMVLPSTSQAPSNIFSQGNRPTYFAPSVPTTDNFDMSQDDAPPFEQDLQNQGYPDIDLNELLDRLPDHSDSETESIDDYNEILSAKDELTTISESLEGWSIKFNVTGVALSALLCILRTHKCFKGLPSDSRTLLKTPSSKIITELISPGNYFHFGIKTSIEKVWLQMTSKVQSASRFLPNCLELLIGIDGLPLFKSGTGEFWPILLSVVNVPLISTKVIPVGIYYGKKKPDSSSSFLTAFVDEITSIMKNGLLFNGKKMSIKVKGFCCDAPAKAFILGIKGHNGYSSCTKCKQPGDYYAGRMTFPVIPKIEDLRRSLRTSEGFLNREDRAFHTNNTVLTQIPGLDFISTFPLDYMHLVCLGVMRTILCIWMFAKPPLKFPFRLIDTISSNLRSLQCSIPSEFARRPRGLEEIKRWKATEFRQFLLYTGPLVLKNCLVLENEHLYDNFLHLHISMRILLSSKFCFQHKDYADALLSRFLKIFKNVYGQQYLTHNFHNLIHLSGSVETFGPLDNSCAFRFENYLFSLKRLIRKGENPLAQIVKRILERMNCTSSNDTTQAKFPFYSSSHLSGPTLADCDSSKQYRKLHFQHFTLTTSIPNSCCSFLDGSIVLIYNIIYSLNHKSMSVISRRFEVYEDFYGLPLLPSSSLGIHLVRKLSNKFEISPITEIKEKIVLLPAGKETYLALPFLHIE